MAKATGAVQKDMEEMQDILSVKMTKDHEPTPKERILWEYESMISSRCPGCWDGCPDCMNPAPPPPYFEEDEEK